MIAIRFSDEQFKRLLQQFLPTSAPVPLKTPSDNLTFDPLIHDVFSFTQLLRNNVDPQHIHKCLRRGAQTWYQEINNTARIGMDTSSKLWIEELEKQFRWTAGKAPVQHNTAHNTPPKTQLSSTPLPQNPQQSSQQPAYQQAAPTERFKQEKVDYKYDGLCSMRRLSKLTHSDTVIFMMSITSASLIQQLQHQAFCANTAYFWSNSRPPGLTPCSQHELNPMRQQDLSRTYPGDHVKRLNSRFAHLPSPLGPHLDFSTVFPSMRIYHPALILNHHLTGSLLHLFGPSTRVYLRPGPVILMFLIVDYRHPYSFSISRLPPPTPFNNRPTASSPYTLGARSHGYEAPGPPFVCIFCCYCWYALGARAFSENGQIVRSSA